ncbi:MAG: hypothetical protein ACREEP_15210 [Dongiaceae bacterium]
MAAIERKTKRHPTDLTDEEPTTVAEKCSRRWPTSSSGMARRSISAATTSTPGAKRELVGLIDGVRESTQSPEERDNLRFDGMGQK